MLDLLQKTGNTHYQLYDDFHAYEERCREKDPAFWKLEANSINRYIGTSAYYGLSLLSKFKLNKSLFIDEFQSRKCHVVEFSNEKKDREMVLNIENLTKPLYQVFHKILDFTSFML